jgi:hypothetical protein
MGFSSARPEPKPRNDAPSEAAPLWLRMGVRDGRNGVAALPSPQATGALRFHIRDSHRRSRAQRHVLQMVNRPIGLRRIGMS